MTDVSSPEEVRSMDAFTVFRDGSSAQKARPSVDYLIGGFSATEDTDLWDEIEEVSADDDTSKVTSRALYIDGDEDEFEVKLSDVVAVADGLRSDHILRFRHMIALPAGNAESELAFGFWLTLRSNGVDVHTESITLSSSAGWTTEEIDIPQAALDGHDIDYTKLSLHVRVRHGSLP